jgi:hypothetical protein
MKTKPTLDDIQEAIERTNIRADLSAMSKHKLIEMVIELMAKASLAQIEAQEKKIITLQ